MRRHTIELLSLLVAAVGATASVFAWPDFRWRILHDSKYRPEQPEVVTTGQIIPGEGVSEHSGNSATLGWYEIRAAGVRASSVLPPSRVAGYGPEMAVDGRWATVWVEGAAGDGVGDWIELELGTPATAYRVGIVNGYGRGPRFRENERVRDAVITFSDGSGKRIQLADHNDLQYFDVTPTTTRSVRLTIASVYPGTRWSDAAIGEIRVWGRR